MLQRRVDLQHGRTLTVTPGADAEDLVEIHAADGTLELRLKLTEDGVVLQLEAARIGLKAEQSIDLECQSFNVSAATDVHIQSGGDLRVRGQRVYIN
jgi:phage gp45-like